MLPTDDEIINNLGGRAAVAPSFLFIKGHRAWKRSNGAMVLVWKFDWSCSAVVSSALFNDKVCAALEINTSMC